MEYAEWALRGDGPALYSKPTPIDCVVSDEDPAYIVRISFFFLYILGLSHPEPNRNQRESTNRIL